MELDKHIRDNAARRESFMALAERVFGLSFREWYAGGWWSERYRPYVLAHGDRVLACIAVNVMDTAWRGKDRRYIQLGTVMTDPACRGQGLSRRLMEAVLADWEDACDGIYLFANETVLEFYPRFGFERAAEYEWTLPVRQEAGPCRRLDMDSAADRERLRRAYDRGSPYAALPARNNFGLLMFYAGSVYKEAVYYMEDWDMAAVAARNEGRLICLDVFGGGQVPLAAVLARLARGKEDVTLGFAPPNGTGAAVRPLGGDDALFVLRGKENPLREGRLRFPALSHA